GSPATRCCWLWSPRRVRFCSRCSADWLVAAAGRATRVPGASADSAAASEAADSAAVDSAVVAEDSGAAAPPEAGRREVAMKFLRLIRHLATTRWSTRRHFTPQVREAIEQAIGGCEAHHAGEIRFVVETAFDLPELWRDLPPRQRALQLYSCSARWRGGRSRHSS